MTPEQLAELFIEDKHDILPNIMTDIEILVKNAFKAGYACAVDKTEEWLNDKAILGWIEDEEAEKFIEQYLKEIQLWVANSSQYPKRSTNTYFGARNN